MEYIVYVIQSTVDQRLYKGLVQDPEARLKEHNAGKNFSTKPYIPWRLVYSKVFLKLPEARRHEKFLKSGQGRDLLKKHLG